MRHRIRRAVSIAQALCIYRFTMYTVYRAEIAIWVFAGILPLLMMFIWMELAETGSLGGYSSTKFAAYFLLVFIIRQMTPFIVIRELDEEIRLGTLSGKLLLPLDPYWHHLVEQLVDPVHRLPFVIPILALGFYFTNGWSEISAAHAPAYVVAFVGALVVHYNMQYCFGLLALWWDRAHAIENLVWTAYISFGGGLVPLSLLPEALYAVIEHNPFRYIISFPVEIALGDITGDELFWGIAIQYTWAVTFIVLSRVIWRLGIKRYEAFGS